MNGFCFAFLLCTLVVSEHVRYDRHKLVQVIPRTAKQLDLLKTLQRLFKGHEQVDFWIGPRRLGVPVDVRISPDLFDHLYGYFSVYGLEPRVMITDVQIMIDRQRFVPKNPMLGLKEIDYGQYHELDEIVAWMKNLTTTYPERVSEINIGSSFENRSITGLRISTNGGENKKAFWIEGAIHAREWITSATILYMTSQMLDTYDSDPAMKEWVDLFDWYIVPVVNVDGYEYTWTNDRMWRKTRSTTEGSSCHGTDPNRNWDIHWCEEGASRDPCSDLFCGVSAFSEVEVKSLSDYIRGVQNLQVFIDFHSYFQLWMTPWGYTEELPPDYAAQKTAGEVGTTALRSVHGKIYEVGSIANIIYVSSGSSADWVYDVAKVKYSYGVELRDEGEYGFLLPADQIIPSGQETLKALEELAKYVANNP